MKTQRNGLYRFILMLILVIALIRFSPVILRVIQAATIGVRGYWWVVLPVLITSWLIWKMIKRGSAAKKSGHQFESQQFIDVTNSSQGRSEKNSATVSLPKNEETNINQDRDQKN